MSWLLILAPALAAGLPAAPAGYAHKTEAATCALFLGPRQSDGVEPVWVRCYWAERSYERLDALLSDWEGHKNVFSAVADCTPIGEQNGDLVVHQRNVASGIGDRELDMVMSKTAVTAGARWGWTMADVQSEPRDSGSVQAIRNDGAWTVTRADAGGVWVVYELAYDPGGSVPGFVIRAFQGSGVLKLVGELWERSG